MKDQKKIKDTLSVLEAQKDNAMIRIDDPFYSDQKAHLSLQLIKIENEIKRLNKLIWK